MAVPPSIVIEPVSPASSSAGAVGFLSREHILEATEACFAESGYDGTTIRAIAQRLGCSVGSIYRYFDDKRALLLTCAARVLEPVAQALRDEPVTFEASLASYAAAAQSHRQLYRLLFWLTDGVPAPVAAIIDGWADRLGGRDESERRWAHAHGLLQLGEPIDTVAAQRAPESFVAPTMRAPEVEDDVTLL